MSWAVGYDTTWRRDVGYGVPALCDHPDCTEEIDRGLAYVCGGQPFGGEYGCGLYFCGQHGGGMTECEHSAYEPKPDLPVWIKHKLTDESWQQWRDKNPHEVERLRGAA